MSKSIGVDQAAVDLAEHCLADCPNAAPADIEALAVAIQYTCEEFCSMVDARVPQ